MQLQVDGIGFGFVEVLSECPTHWGMSSVEAEAHVRDVMTKQYPLGVVKDEVREPWFFPPKPNFEPDKLLEAVEASRVKPPSFCDKFPEHIDPVDVSLKLAGAGGDGAQTAAYLITRAAINEGFDATHIPSYGPESRGGTSYADVHVAEARGAVTRCSDAPRVGGLQRSQLGQVRLHGAVGRRRDLRQ